MTTLSEAIATKKANTEEDLSNIPNTFTNSIGTVVNELANPTDYFTRSGAYESTDNVKNMQEFPIFGIPNTDNRLQQFSQIISAKPNVRRGILQDALPDANFSMTPEGDEVLSLDGVDYVTNKKGASLQDATTTLSQILQYIPAARWAKKAKTPVGRILRNMFAEPTTSVVQDVAAQQLGSNENIDLKTVGTNTINAGLRSGTGELLGSFTERKPQDVPPEAMPNVTEANLLTDKTGIDLARGQQIYTPSVLEDMSILTLLPNESSQQAYKFLAKQNKQAADAVSQFVKAIAPPESLVVGSKNFRDTSKQAIDNLIEQRTNAANPFFRQAKQTSNGIILDIQNDLGVKTEYETGKAITNPATGLPTGENIKTNKIRRFVIENIDKDGNPEQISIDVQSSAGKKIRQIMSAINRAGNNFDELDAVKDQLNAMLEKNATSGLDRKTAKHLRTIKNKLVQTFENQSPDYKQGMDIYRNMSPEINQLEESLIGRVSKIKDIDLRKISGMIFNATETNPEILKTVKTIINNTNPEAFNQLLNVEIQRRLGKLKIPESNVAGSVNMPNLYNKAIFGTNDAQANIIFQSLSGDMRKNARFLREVLTRASGGRPTGSSTAMRGPRIEELGKTGVFSKLSGLLTNLFSVTGKGVLMNVDDNVKQATHKNITEKLFDPEYASQMSKIREIYTDGNEEQAVGLLTGLLGSSQGFVARETFTDQEAIR